MSAPRVGIVLVNWNSYEDTAACLHSLAAITYPNVEIIVVDNASRDESATKLQAEFPGITFLRSKENAGFTGGNNLGIKYALDADCDHVLLLNNDTFVLPNFLEPLVARMASDSKIAAVSGKIYYAPETRGGEDRIIWYAGCYRKWHMGYHHYGVEEKDTGQFDVPREIPYASGCLMLLRGSALRKIGVLSPEYFIYWEEADWCHRALDAGYICMYEPKSVIYHNFRSAALGYETPFHMYMQYRNALIYAKEHYRGLDSLRFWMFYPIYMFYRFLLDIRAKNSRAAKAIVWGVFDYFRGFRGKQGLKERGFLKS
ncbi:MAG TPA: glycosyltransferase family 2 protein [Candidatus Kapabacteria bacterium]|nr:glycosyltransferase family 2 protein [Candidatus Kapabacteria bacterium]